jgi:type III secretion system low calcium response chaperone LcrH/SycD
VDFKEIDFGAAREQVEAVLAEGYIRRDFTEITQEEMEAVYATAFSLLNQGELAQALAAFRFLSYLDHHDVRFWMGVGLCRQQLKDHEGAVKAFAMAGTLKVENPAAAVRAAECYLAMHRHEEADSALTAALHWAADKPEHAAVRARAQALRDGLARRKGGAQP